MVGQAADYTLPGCQGLPRVTTSGISFHATSIFRRPTYVVIPYFDACPHIAARYQLLVCVGVGSWELGVSSHLPTLPADPPDAARRARLIESPRCCKHSLSLSHWVEPTWKVGVWHHEGSIC